MKKMILAAAIFFLISIPKQAQCQFDRARVTKYLTDYVNQHYKPSGKERESGRKEAENRRQIQNQIDAMSEYELLNHIDDSDYHYQILNDNRDRLMSALYNSGNILDNYKDDDLRKIIMEDPKLMGKVINAMRSQKERILDFARDPYLNQLIMNDPSLRKDYDQMHAKQDIKRNPERVLDYILDPKMRQIIKEDPDLAKILAQQLEKKAQEERELQERLDADEKAENNRKEWEKQKEVKRITDEDIRAKDQEKRNEKERTETNTIQNEQLESPIFAQLPNISSLNISIPDPNALMISKPIGVFEMNNSDNLSKKGEDNDGHNQNIQGDYFDEDLEKKSYLEEKVDDVKDWLDAKDYPYKANKAFKASKETYSTVIKEAPNYARRKVISIPKDNLMDKLKGWGRNIINIAYPDANLEEKAEVVIEVEKNEKGFIEGMISDIIDVVSTGDLQKFEESTNARTKKFDDKNRSLANRYIKAWGK